MTAYYNEIDPFAAAWLRELIKAGVIAPGFVDERSIEDVSPDDLRPYTQCHFFAGIGVWSYALRQAGWPDDRPVWTGSCPCQGFSEAGRQKGFEDERHLWPVWQKLIADCRPPVIFGEQVASNLIVGATSKERDAADWNAEKIKDGSESTWFDLVQADLERAAYASAAFDLPAAGFGAPNLRQRLFFVGVDAGVGNSSGKGLEGHAGNGNGSPGRSESIGPITKAGGDGELADFPSERCERCEQGRAGNTKKECDGATRDGAEHEIKSANPTNGFWAGPDWLLCRDGKFRPVESESFPLVDGTSNRMGKLRGYGNAINAEVAKEFIKAAINTLEHVA